MGFFDCSNLQNILNIRSCPPYANADDVDAIFQGIAGNSCCQFYVAQGTSTADLPTLFNGYPFNSLCEYILIIENNGCNIWIARIDATCDLSLEESYTQIVIAKQPIGAKLVLSGIKTYASAGLAVNPFSFAEWDSGGIITLPASGMVIPEDGFYFIHAKMNIVDSSGYVGNRRSFLQVNGAALIHAIDYRTPAPNGFDVTATCKCLYCFTAGDTVEFIGQSSGGVSWSVLGVFPMETYMELYKISPGCP